jgi:hypothetical protein
MIASNFLWGDAQRFEFQSQMFESIRAAGKGFVSRDDATRAQIPRFHGQDSEFALSRRAYFGTKLVPPAQGLGMEWSSCHFVKSSEMADIGGSARTLDRYANLVR